ncbi:hypothetical protein GQ42DRAFT_162337 [Ramicandelaber brevisporus]|nr:hypothetical protein GQ42DRAFT_162337 [Ramicandelaber brevisporus]
MRVRLCAPPSAVASAATTATATATGTVNATSVSVVAVSSFSTASDAFRHGSPHALAALQPRRDPTFDMAHLEYHSREQIRMVASMASAHAADQPLQPVRQASSAVVSHSARSLQSMTASPSNKQHEHQQQHQPQQQQPKRIEYPRKAGSSLRRIGALESPSSMSTVYLDQIRIVTPSRISRQSLRRLAPGCVDISTNSTLALGYERDQTGLPFPDTSGIDGCKYPLPGHTSDMIWLRTQPASLALRHIQSKATTYSSTLHPQQYSSTSAAAAVAADSQQNEVNSLATIAIPFDSSANDRIEPQVKLLSVSAAATWIRELVNAKHGATASLDDMSRTAEKIEQLLILWRRSLSCVSNTSSVSEPMPQRLRDLHMAWVDGSERTLATLYDFIRYFAARGDFSRLKRVCEMICANMYHHQVNVLPPSSYIRTTNPVPFRAQDDWRRLPVELMPDMALAHIIRSLSHFGLSNLSSKLFMRWLRLRSSSRHVRLPKALAADVRISWIGDCAKKPRNPASRELMLTDGLHALVKAERLEDAFEQFNITVNGFKQKLAKAAESGHYLLQQQHVLPVDARRRSIMLSAYLKMMKWDDAVFILKHTCNASGELDTRNFDARRLQYIWSKDRKTPNQSKNQSHEDEELDYFDSLMFESDAYIDSILVQHFIRRSANKKLTMSLEKLQSTLAAQQGTSSTYTVEYLMAVVIRIGMKLSHIRMANKTLDQLLDPSKPSPTITQHSAATIMLAYMAPKLISVRQFEHVILRLLAALRPRTDSLAAESSEASLVLDQRFVCILIAALNYCGRHEELYAILNELIPNKKPTKATIASGANQHLTPPPAVINIGILRNVMVPRQIPSKVLSELCRLVDDKLDVEVATDLRELLLLRQLIGKQL